MAWEDDIDREFPVVLRVDTFNKVGVLATLAGTISDCESNIEEASVHDEEDASEIRFVMKVRNTGHLDDVMRKLDALDDVMRVTRVCD